MYITSAFSCSKSTLISSGAHVCHRIISHIRRFFWSQAGAAGHDARLCVYIHRGAVFLQAVLRPRLLSFMAIGVKSCPSAARKKFIINCEWQRALGALMFCCRCAWAFHIASLPLLRRNGHSVGVRTYIFVLDNKHNGAGNWWRIYSGGAEGKWRRPAHTSVEYATLRNRQMSKSRFLSVPPPLRAIGFSWLPSRRAGS